MRKKSFLQVLHLVTKAGIGLLGIACAYLFVMAIIGLLGLLPPHLHATFEVSIDLQNAQNFYPTEDLDPEYSVTHIEVPKANLEVLPKNKQWPQFLGYLFAAIYTAFFLFILTFLSRVLQTFKINQPFLKRNVSHIRWMGLITLGISIYEFCLNTFIAGFFSSKFSIHGADLKRGADLWEINFTALFLGLVLLTLAEAFKKGNELQTLEDLTV